MRRPPRRTPGPGYVPSLLDAKRSAGFAAAGSSRRNYVRSFSGVMGSEVIRTPVAS